MAEPPAAPSHKYSEEPMTSKSEVAQPQGIDETAISREENNAGPQTVCDAGRAATKTNPPLQDAGEPDGLSTATADGSEGAVENPDCRVEAKKKKKKSRTPKSRRGITGFEEYYADAPMTPAEALDKKKLYDPTRPFPDRIEECIQRFRARRRLDSQRTDMFNKYLFLGGIDASPRQFTGVAHDKDIMVGVDNEQIRTMTAVDFVGGCGSRFYDHSTSEDWEVDFEAIVKGFLSRTITDWYMYDEVAIRLAADLIKNFLNYVLMQDVCPEYASNIMAARHICDIAPTELRYMHELMSVLPGTFNSAARSLFCDKKVNHTDQDENYDNLVIFRLTTLLWSMGEKEKQYREQILKAENPATIELVATREVMYQVIGIDRPRQKDKKMVDEQLTRMGLNRKLQPAGFIRVVPTIIAHGWGNLPRPDEANCSFAEKEVEEFILEDEILAKFEVGMKIHMTVCELNVGFRFIKDIHDVRVSFDTFLPQYLMTDWKDPIPNERPPPSIHNPNAEEKAISVEAEVDD